MRSASRRPGSPVAALALPELNTTAAARPFGEVPARDLDRRGLREVRGEHARRAHRHGIGGRDEREIGIARRLDPARDPARDETGNRGDARGHGWIPSSGRPVVSGSPRRMFAAWIIWPDAPFTRLSSAAIAITVSVRSSKRTVTCTTFAP